jgi:hypothetical protein
MTNTKRRGHWHNCVRTHQTNCVDNQIFQLLKGGIDQWGVDHNNPFFFLELHQRQQILELRKLGK